MFESLGEKFESLKRKLQGHGRIRERNIEDALRDVRLALLEADVNVDVVRGFIERVKADALGSEVLKSLTPEQQFIKLVHRELIHCLGGEPVPFTLGADTPAVVMMVGLNGAGKTTTSGKLARHLREEMNQTPLLVAADVYRPAAIEQLQTLGRTLDVPVHAGTPGSDPVAIAQAGVAAAKDAGASVVVIDTAGRQTVDEQLMDELVRMQAAVTPGHVLLVADAMTGQDAVATASGFGTRLPLTGCVLTKIEGDARGGAALSLREVTGTPILFAGTGEKLDAFEPFMPERVASRILDKGDVLSFIERAEKAYDADQAAALQKKLKKNEFTLEDFKDQLGVLKKMGPIGELMGMIPGLKKMFKGADLGDAEGELKRIEGIINSMTFQERDNHLILNASRRRRIAAGSGTTVSEVNRLLKQFTQMRKMLKKIGSGPMLPGMPGLHR